MIIENITNKTILYDVRYNKNIDKYECCCDDEIMFTLTGAELRCLLYDESYKQFKII